MTKKRKSPSTKYYLRRSKRVKYTEISDGEEVDDDSDYVEDEEDDGEVFITIHQEAKKKVHHDFLVGKLKNEDLDPVPFPIKTFEDLVKLVRKCKKEGKLYKDCQILVEAHDVLEEIDAMIGLKSLKEGLYNMIIYEIHQSMKGLKHRYWRNMVITGPSGSGKTSVAELIAKLFNRLGMTPSDEIVHGNPINMISGYMGQTKDYVNQVVQKALEKSGILFIDEAPSLNDANASSDSYGRKCLDTLMQLMDTHKDELIVIFAGYKDEMDKNIIQSNQGFRRRIQWFFNIKPYSARDLHLIFKKLLEESKFKLKRGTCITEKWFTEQYEADKFPYFGGSVHNLVEKIKISFAQITFGQDTNNVLSDACILNAFRLYNKYNIQERCK